MNKSILIAMMALTLVSSVFGAGDVLDPLDTTMAENDVELAQYCVHDVVPEDGTLTVVVDPVCEDLNGISGCQAADDLATTEFTAVSQGDITLVDGAGCTYIELTTIDASGRFYYTVNGEIGQAEITSETGSVFVPEFTTVGAALALLGAGFYAYKKRD